MGALEVCFLDAVVLLFAFGGVLADDLRRAGLEGC